MAASPLPPPNPLDPALAAERLEHHTTAFHASGLHYIFSSGDRMHSILTTSRATTVSTHFHEKSSLGVSRLGFLRGDLLQVEIFMLFLCFRIENTRFLPKSTVPNSLRVSPSLLRWITA